MAQGFNSDLSLWSLADHPLFVCPLLLLKSEHQAFVLIRRNTDEHYGGYNLFQNTDLNRNVQVKFKQNVDLVVICHIFFTFPSSLKSYLQDDYLTSGLELKKETRLAAISHQRTIWWIGRIPLPVLWLQSIWWRKNCTQAKSDFP